MNTFEPLFKAGYTYPRDETGCYVELFGKVTEVSEPLGEEVVVKVETERHGPISGACSTKYAPKVDYFARIRVYDAGGGFYPDNRIIAWSMYSEQP